MKHQERTQKCVTDLYYKTKTIFNPNEETS